VTLILVAESQFAPQALAALDGLGDVEICTDAAAFAARIEAAEAVLVALEIPLTPQLMARAERLRVIATRTSQLRHLDVAEAERRGIAVLSIAADAPALQATNSTAEEAIAMLLALVRNVPWAFDALKDGRWERGRYGGRELAGKTIGLVGYGRLGRKTAAYARAFGMRVLATDPNVDINGDAEARPLSELLAESDIVSLHCTWSEETRGLIGATELASMKQGAYLVNTARGEITDEAALLEALESGHLAGAAIDTLADETADGSHLRDNPLVDYARTHENLIVLPHLGGATVEATERTQVYIAEQLRDWLQAHA
jgi:D-3-phosphoglycerate dehydrogenase